MGIVPIVTKADLPHAQPDETILAMATTFDLDPDDVIVTSAKSGIGIEHILPVCIVWMYMCMMDRHAAFTTGIYGAMYMY